MCQQLRRICDNLGIQMGKKKKFMIGLWNPNPNENCIFCFCCFCFVCVLVWFCFFFIFPLFFLEHLVITFFKKLFFLWGHILFGCFPLFLLLDYVETILEFFLNKKKEKKKQISYFHRFFKNKFFIIKKKNLKLEFFFFFKGKVYFQD